MDDAVAEILQELRDQVAEMDPEERAEVFEELRSLEDEYLDTREYGE